MQPKDAQEKLAERVEHLNKKVPPQTHIGRQIWQQKTHTVCRRQKVPGAGQKGGAKQQGTNCDGQTKGMHNDKRRDLWGGFVL